MSKQQRFSTVSTITKDSTNMETIKDICGESKKTTFEQILIDMATWSMAKHCTYTALRQCESMSGDGRIRELLQSLPIDIKTIENCNIDKILSPSADLLFEAYNVIVNQSGTIEQALSEEIFKIGCKAVNAEIYRHKGENAFQSTNRVRVPVKQDNGKVKMIALLEGQTFEDGKIRGIATSDKYRTIKTCLKHSHIDAEIDVNGEPVYFKSNNIYGIDSLEDYETVTEILTALNLSEKDSTILKCRLKGLKEQQIAEKLNVSQSAIHQRIQSIRNRMVIINPAYAKYAK